MVQDVKAVVERAVRSLAELVPDAEKVNFEEFEVVDGPDGKERADVTLSFERKSEEPVYFNSITDRLAEQITGTPVGPRRPKHFRVFTVSEDGRLLAMKLRKRS